MKRRTKANGIKLMYGDKSGLMPKDFNGIDSTKKVLLVASENNSVAFVVGTDRNGKFIIAETANPKQISCDFAYGYVRMRPCENFDGFAKSLFIRNFDLRGELLVLTTLRCLNHDRLVRLRELGIEFDTDAMLDFYKKLVIRRNAETFASNPTQEEISRLMASSGISCTCVKEKNANANKLFKNEIEAGKSGLPFFDGKYIAQICRKGVSVFRIDSADDAITDSTISQKVSMPKRVCVIDSPIGSFCNWKEYDVLEWIERLGKRYARIVDENGDEVRISMERIGEKARTTA